MVSSRSSRSFTKRIMTLWTGSSVRSLFDDHRGVASAVGSSRFLNVSRAQPGGSHEPYWRILDARSICMDEYATKNVATLRPHITGMILYIGRVPGESLRGNGVYRARLLAVARDEKP